MYVFNQPHLLQAECDMGSILKWNTTGFNVEFFFETGCYTKVSEPSLPYYLP